METLANSLAVLAVLVIVAYGIALAIKSRKDDVLNATFTIAVTIVSAMSTCKIIQIIPSLINLILQAQQSQ